VNTDHDVKAFLERMAAESAVDPVDPRPVLRRAHRRLVRTSLVGLAGLAAAIALAIGSTSLVRSEGTTPAVTGGTGPVATTGATDCSGEACLGSLQPGTYATDQFEPSLTYTVPAGWNDISDSPGQFLLRRPDTPDAIVIGVYQRVRAPRPCRVEPDLGVGASVQEMTTWLTSHPGLVTSDPVPVTVGGLSGERIDVSLAPSWTGTCPWFGNDPIVPIMVGLTPTDLHHTIFEGLQERLYLLSYRGAVLAIEIGPEGNVPHDFPKLNDYVDEITPIVESIRFDV
jgi:hypothetical protein